MNAVSEIDAADDDLNIIQGFKVNVSLSGRSSCLKRNRLCDVVWAIGLFLLASCGGGSGSKIMIIEEAILVADSFVPENEQVVGFPDTKTGAEERQRIAALHQRGGTGKGQLVGIFDSGVNSDHPDLTGQFKYSCSLGRCNGKGGSDNDNRPELDSVGYQSPLQDTDGHGTAVNGIVVARRNGVGIYGIAYEAKIASFGNTAPVPWDATCSSPKPPCWDKKHVWGSVFDQQVARGVDWMRSLGVKTINNSWTRTYAWTADSGLTQTEAGKILPLSLSAFQNYVNNDGVVVFASGNRGTNHHPDIEAVLPHYFNALKPGWLAVGALSQNGQIAPFSQRCGVAADWCIVAPGEMVTTSIDGKWAFSGGTSFAAPYVSASLAALKSLFPSLTYHQLRTRILATADKTGIYADRQLYGQGRLNLDAASRPVGQTSLAVGTQTNGPVLPARYSGITLPNRFALQPVARGSLLILDSFQRAPFFVKLTSFIRSRPAYLSFSDLTLPDSRPIPATQTVVQRWQQDKGYTAFGKGSDLMSSFQQMSSRGLPLTSYQFSEQAAGLSIGTNRWQFIAAHDSAEPDISGYGLSSAAPSAYFATGMTLSSDLRTLHDSRLALALSSGLRHPLGWAGTGAFEVEGQGVELGWSQAVQVTDKLSFQLTGRLSHLNPGSGPLLNFDKILLMAGDLAADMHIHEQTKARITFGREQPVSSATAHLRTAQAVSTDGRIIVAQTRFSTAELATFDRLSFGLRHFTHNSTTLGAGITALRDGFGQTELFTGLRLDVRF